MPLLLRVIIFYLFVSSCLPAENDICNECYVYKTRFRRLVNQLLINSNLKSAVWSEEAAVNYTFKFHITQDNLEALQRFGDSKEVSLYEVDSALNEMLNIYSRHTCGDEMKNSYFEFDLPIWVFWMLFSLFVLYYTKKNVYLTFLISLFFIDMYFSYWKLYNDALAVQLTNMKKYRDIPVECLHQTSFMFSTFDTHECTQYHKAILDDPTMSISPLDVFLNTLSKTVFGTIKNCVSVLTPKNLNFKGVFGSLFTNFVLLIYQLVFPFVILITLFVMGLSCFKRIQLGKFLGITLVDISTDPDRDAKPSVSRICSCAPQQQKELTAPVPEKPLEGSTTFSRRPRNASKAISGYSISEHCTSVLTAHSELNCQSKGAEVDVKKSANIPVDQVPRYLPAGAGVPSSLGKLDWTYQSQNLRDGNSDGGYKTLPLMKREDAIWLRGDLSYDERLLEHIRATYCTRPARNAATGNPSYGWNFDHGPNPNIPFDNRQALQTQTNFLNKPAANVGAKENYPPANKPYTSQLSCGTSQDYKVRRRKVSI